MEGFLALEALVKLSRPSADTPVLITAAEPSLSEQHEARRRKYILMMSTRVVCLILAAACYHIKWLMGLFAIAALVLPWAAVLVANDRPAKRAMRINFFKGRRNAPRQVGRPAAAEIGPAARVIDPDD
jgi:Protein of unknown function (DUF3099)